MVLKPKSIAAARPAPKTETAGAAARGRADSSTQSTQPQLCHKAVFARASPFDLQKGYCARSPPVNHGRVIL
jgi:hypothetical protein